MIELNYLIKIRSKKYKEIIEIILYRAMMIENPAICRIFL